MTLDLVFSMRDIYINFNLNPLTKFTSSSRSTKFKDIYNLNQHKNSHKLCDEMEHPIVN